MKIKESNNNNDFKEYLQNFLKEIIPLSLRIKGIKVFRKEIDLNDYDFSSASVHLIASVNGRF
jgi:hypothetical protein